MHLYITFFFVYFAVMIAASSSENSVAGQNDVVGDDVKRRPGNNVDSLIRFGKRRMYQKQMNEQYDDLLEDVVEKRAPNPADMMIRFGRTRGNADRMLRFG